MGYILNYTRNLISVAFGRQPSRPLLFSYYVTHRCDLNCSYCSDGDGKRFKEEKVPELSTLDAKKLLSILRDSADTLDVTGGEPTLREDLEEILAFAREIGFRTVLNTKGIGLEKRPDLLRFSDVLVLSLDTLDTDLLCQMVGRTRETAESILTALNFAMTRRNETGTKLVLSAVATPTNLAGVSEVLDFAIANGLGFHISPEIVGTVANPALRSNNQYEDLVESVLERKRTHRGVLGVKQYFQGIRSFGSFRCYPLLMPVIRPDGRMYYPCLESKQAQVSVLEAGSYEIALKAARQMFGKIPECRNCCHIFCHMALSLLQRHPLAALAEHRHWED